MPKPVAKVTIEAPIVSFRYPHFLIGRQPTFEMPPPSTIFGQVAAALGEWPGFPISFAYAFQSRGRASDLEHQQIISRASGNLPGNVPDPMWQPPKPRPGKKLTKKDQQPRLLQKTTEATVQPYLRDFLFDIRLELYLDPPELAAAFRSPMFTMTLGRSQDLASIRRVERIDLEPATDGYVEQTILPAEFRRRLPWGVTTLMPRYVGPPPERDPFFAPFILLRDRVYVGTAGPTMPRRILSIQGESIDWWADPTSEEDRGGRRLLWFHTLDPAEFERASA